MFLAEATYTAMECRSSSPRERGAVSGTYLLKDDEAEDDSEDEDSGKGAPKTQTPSPVKSRKCILAISLASIFVVGVAVAVLVLVFTALMTPPNGASSPVAQGHSVLSTPLPTMVTPRCGDLSSAVVCLDLPGSSCDLMLIGNREEDVFVFKGIPYALPPNLERRWKQPVTFTTSCSATEAVRPLYAQSFGNKCMQLGKDGVRSEGSEDCLYLNIWSPNLTSDADLHVMVYFHGGGLISGSGNENGSLPTPELVTEANMVFVTFNYRLGAFGFMALEALAVDGAAGNYGLMDQILALQWVQNNIRNFGGSPDKVTVFGQGSGATSIYALLASEHAAGLFQKAWLASPSPKLENSLTEAYDQNAEFLNNTECADGGLLLEDRLACLLNLSAEKVLQALPWNSWRNMHFYRLPLKTERSVIIAVVDGFVLKLSPLDAWKRKKFNAVRLLIGNTAQETDIFMMNEKLVGWSSYDNYVYQFMVPFDHVRASDVLTMYGHLRTPEHSLATMVSDMRAICPVDEMVKVAANASLLVYRYIASFFANEMLVSSGIQKNYAYSGIDVEAFFNRETATSTRINNHFTTLMRDTVFSFVRNSSISDWDTFPHSTYNISTTVEKIAPRFESPECNFWRTNWFFPNYAWMN